MGASGSLPAYAPDSLSKKVQKIPDRYVELRNPNGSVVHLVGVAPLAHDQPAKVRALIRAATPDSVLLQLCAERVPPVWELIERGTLRADGSVRDPLKPLSYDVAAGDSRLRDFAWWFLGGLEAEGVAAGQGTCLGAAQAAAAHEASRLRAQTHLLDRQLSATANRCVNAAVAAWWAAPSGSADGDALAEALAVLLAAASGDPADGDRVRGALDAVAAELAAPGDSAPAKTAAAAVFGACKPLLGAERSEILAHRCWEAAESLGPGGVAVAVVGVEHVDAIAGHWSKTDPKRVEALLGAPPAYETLGALAPGLAAAAAACALPAALPRGGPRGLALAALAAAPVAGLAWATRDRALAYTKVARLQRDLEDVRDRAPSLRASNWSSK